MIFIAIPDIIEVLKSRLWWYAGALGGYSPEYLILPLVLFLDQKTAGKKSVISVESRQTSR